MVCFTPLPTASILLVALLKPVPELNFDLVMFIFQNPTCGLSVWAMITEAAATITRTPAMSGRRVIVSSPSVVGGAVQGSRLQAPALKAGARSPKPGNRGQTVLIRLQTPAARSRA